jgi:LysM repeat protein
MSTRDDDGRVYTESAPNWWLRHVLIPVGIAVIAGSFALVVAIMVSYREVEITGMQITRDFEILATEVAVNEAAGAANPAPGDSEQVVQNHGTITPTMTPPPPPPTVPLPPPPLPPPTVSQCGQVPSGWQLYRVRRGDTLYSLARRTGTSVAAIQQVNCLSGTTIYDGHFIWLPAAATVIVTPPSGPPTEEPTIVVTEPPTDEPPTEEPTRVVAVPEVTEEPVIEPSSEPRITGGVSVVRVWTADGSWNPKTTFQPGDVIQWVITVDNTMGQQARIDLTFEALGPNRQRTAYWSGPVTTDAGVKSWDYKGMVTDQMLGPNSFFGYGLDHNSPSQANVTYQVTRPAVSPAQTPTVESPPEL